VFCLVKPLLAWHINNAFFITNNNNNNNENDDDDDDDNDDDENDDDNNNDDDDNNTLDLILLLILAGLCCCCCCNFCQPRKLINKAKIYIATNPPGVLFEGGKEKHHEPTAEEIQAYMKLLRRAQKL
jgi:hypothetical protein